MSLPLFVVLGAGRSAGWLIGRLNELAAAGKLALRVVDAHQPAQSLPGGIDFRQAAIAEDYDFTPLLDEAFCCISLLPPPLHPLVIETCLRTGTHFISASYESPAACSHADEAAEKGILILNECGLDPGLDHVTALAMLARIQAWGGKIVSFESDCGGLPSLQDRNEWGYRFFWNPLNVITAGAAGARFKLDGQTRLISSSEVFKQYRPLYEDAGRMLVAYPNRDSVPYQHQYGLSEIDTYIRGTIRYQEYCDRWTILAEANVANTSIHIEAGTKYRQWASLFNWQPSAYALLSQLIAEANWEDADIESDSTSADVLLRLLTQYWNPAGPYIDRVLMRHRIVYELGGQQYSYTGTLDIEGTMSYSAMAFTVGLPIAIIAEHLLSNSITGVRTPMDKAIWPIIYDHLPSLNINLKYENLPLP